MKKIVTILSLLVFISSYAQHNKSEFEKHNDSVCLTFRKQADRIINEMDIKQYPVILFSIEDSETKNKHFYVIVNNEGKIREYLVYIDQRNKLKKQKLHTRKKDKKFLLTFFDTKQYHSGYITEIENSTTISCKLVMYYFVLIKQNNKYGEHCLPLFTFPLPIDGELYGYLIRRFFEY
jgi:hypothetical protein